MRRAGSLLLLKASRSTSFKAVWLGRHKYIPFYLSRSLSHTHSLYLSHTLSISTHPLPLIQSQSKRDKKRAKLEQKTSSHLSLITPNIPSDSLHSPILGKSSTVLDCFSGCGGNSIAFAKKFDHVIAIDIDFKKLEHLRYNAAVYNVHEQIELICANTYDILLFMIKLNVKMELVLLAPPWGGVAYRDDACVFDLHTM